MKNIETSMITYKFRLYPTREQEERFTATLNLCCWLYNSALKHRIIAYRRAKKSITRIDQIKELSAIKKDHPELAETMNSRVLEGVIYRLQEAYNAFFRRLKTRKAGEKAGFPKFQGEDRYNSFNYLGYPNRGYDIKTIEDKPYLFISKVGNVKINLHRNIEGNIRTCSITRKNGKWYACISSEITAHKVKRTGEKVGVDLGLASLAITSNGEFLESFKYLLKAERRLKFLQRMVSRRKKVPIIDEHGKKRSVDSNRRRKARMMLSKQHEKVANRRNDAINKAVHALLKKYDYIALEDLKVKNMMKNRKLSKRIADSAWGKFIAKVQTKAQEMGKEVVLVNPHNTSQLCSSCGEVVKKELKVRIHACPHFGYVEDRDVNAAKNILMRALGETPSPKMGQLELKLTEAGSVNRGWMYNSTPDETRNLHQLTNISALTRV